MLLRWCVQRELVVLPKSTHRERIEENAQVFDFALSDDDMAALDALDDTGGTASRARAQVVVRAMHATIGGGKRLPLPEEPA